MNPRALAYTVTATIAAIATLLVFGVGMFLVGCVFAALVWVAVVTEQRDEALTDYVGEVFTNAALKAEVERLEIECDALHQENMALHLELTELQLVTDPTTQVPRLRVVDPIADDDWFAQREAGRESLR